MVLIQLDAECFQSPADQHLLHRFLAFRDQLYEGFDDSEKEKEEELKRLLDGTLDRNIKQKYTPDDITSRIAQDDDFRRKWRNDRIKLYEALIILALGVEGKEDVYFEKQAATERCEVLCDSNIKRPGSIYAYLVDQIHEDEDILFKHYDNFRDLKKGLFIETAESQTAPRARHICPSLVKVRGARTQDRLEKISGKGSIKLGQKPALWLVASINEYLEHLHSTIFKVMGDDELFPKAFGEFNDDERVGDEPLPKARHALDAKTRAKALAKARANARAKARAKVRAKACAQLLAKAKQAFEAMVSKLGISWERRSWRNRARLYWLLGLAKHTPVSQEIAMSEFKSFDYVGPIGILFQYMIGKDEEMLSMDDKVKLDLLVHYNKEKNDGRKEIKERRQLGTLRLCSLLAWGSAVGDCDLVKSALKHNLAYIKTRDCSHEWEKKWKEYWAHALWNATYRNHAEIVKELLSCMFPDHKVYFEYYSAHSMEPPLHVAVRRKNVSVVAAFCAIEDVVSKNFNCNQENAHGQTPLKVCSSLEDHKDTDLAIKREIQSILLRRLEVKEAVKELCKQRDMTVGSANTIMVGATLIAGITFGGWLNPPLSYHSYYQYPEPQPAPPNSYDSYMAIEGHSSIQVFAIFNSLSFFFAIAALLAGMETACFIKAIEEMYIATTVTKLRKKLRWTTILFIASVLCVLVAFGSAGIAILPPIKQYQTSMYCTIGAGGFVSLLFICRVLLFCISKSVNKWTTNKIIDPVKKWIADECFKTKPAPTDPERSPIDSNLLDRDSSRLVDS